MAKHKSITWVLLKEIGLQHLHIYINSIRFNCLIILHQILKYKVLTYKENFVKNPVFPQSFTFPKEFFVLKLFKVFLNNTKVAISLL